MIKPIQIYPNHPKVTEDRWIFVHDSTAARSRGSSAAMDGGN
jgi:hypothetical protein